MVLDAFAGGLIESRLDYHNFVFFSITTVHQKAVSLGFLTQAVVFAGEMKSP
jgi:hypothetical protein